VGHFQEPWHRSLTGKQPPLYWMRRRYSFRSIVSGAVYTNPPFPEARAYAERGRPMMAVLRCVFGNPFRPVTLEVGHKTPTTVALAQAAYCVQRG